MLRDEKQFSFPIRLAPIHKKDNQIFIIAHNLKLGYKLSKTENEIVSKFDGFHSFEMISEEFNIDINQIKELFEILKKNNYCSFLYEWNKFRFIKSKLKYTCISNDLLINDDKLDYISLDPPCDLRPLSIPERKYIFTFFEQMGIKLPKNILIMVNTVFRKLIDNEYKWQIVINGVIIADLLIDNVNFKNTKLILHFSKESIEDLTQNRLEYNEFNDLSKHLDISIHKRITRISEISKRFIIKQYKKYGNNNLIFVRFSGGKDSIVLLHLIKELKLPFVIGFVNIGVECPDTVEFVKEIEKKWGITIITKNYPRFWQTFKIKGYPTKDNRWCTNLKFDLLRDLSHEVYQNEHFLSLEGSRFYEEERRYFWEVDTDHNIDNCTVILPLSKWTALDIWGYILDKEIHINPLYAKGFERVACWLCPGAGSISRQIVKEVYPKLAKKFPQYEQFKWEV